MAKIAALALLVLAICGMFSQAAARGYEIPIPRKFQHRQDDVLLIIRHESSCFYENCRSAMNMRYQPNLHQNALPLLRSTAVWGICAAYLLPFRFRYIHTDICRLFWLLFCSWCQLQQVLLQQGRSPPHQEAPLQALRCLWCQDSLYHPSPYRWHAEVWIHLRIWWWLNLIIQSTSYRFTFLLTNNFNFSANAASALPTSTTSSPPRLPWSSTRTA